MWKKIYSGFEDVFDLQRDVIEALEYGGVIPKGIGGESQGEVVVTIEYIPSEEEKSKLGIYSECPECKKKTLRAKELHEGGGVICVDKECGYWFCY